MGFSWNNPGRKEAVKTLNAARKALNENPDRTETDRYHDLNGKVNEAIKNPALPWYRRAG